MKLNEQRLHQDLLDKLLPDVFMRTKFSLIIISSVFIIKVTETVFECVFECYSFFAQFHMGSLIRKENQ